MHAFDAEHVSCTDISALQPGEFFLFEEEARYCLAVAMARQGESGQWLNLEGANAFQFGVIDRHVWRLPTLRLPISPGRIRLKIDRSSAASDYASPVLGQLVFGREGKAGIAAAWAGLEGRYRNVLELDSWAQGSVDEPRFIFDRWALSYVDDAGQWKDLLVREPKGKAP